MARGNGKGRGGKGGKRGGGMPYLTGILPKKQQKRLIMGALRSQYAPLMREFDQQEAGSAFRQQKEIPAWYQNYRDQLTRQQTDANTAMTQGQTRMENFATSADQLEGQRRTQIADLLAQDSRARNANTDVAGVDATAGASANARSQATQGVLALMEAQRQTRNAASGERRTNTILAERNAQQAESVRQSKIAADRRAARKQMQDDYFKLALDLLGQNSQFWLDKAALDETKRNNNLDYTASMNDGGGGGGGGSSDKSSLTPRRGVSVLENPKNFGTAPIKKKPTRARRDEMIGFLTNRNYSYASARKAVDRYLAKYKAW